MHAYTHSFTRSLTSTSKTSTFPLIWVLQIIQTILHDYNITPGNLKLWWKCCVLFGENNYIKNNINIKLQHTAPQFACCCSVFLFPGESTLFLSLSLCVSTISNLENERQHKKASMRAYNKMKWNEKAEKGEKEEESNTERKKNSKCDTPQLRIKIGRFGFETHQKCGMLVYVNEFLCLALTKRSTCNTKWEKTILDGSISHSCRLLLCAMKSYFGKIVWQIARDRMIERER